VPDDETRRAIASVWKREAARVIGRLSRILRDPSLAEDFAQEALLAALDHWPVSGIPANPGAWLMTTAKNRALNSLRRSKFAVPLEREDIDTHHVSLEEVEASIEARMDDDVDDDVLRLLFTACHPLLSRESRVALTLRMIGGLTTEEIARAFLSTEPTIAQRVVRAKRAIGEASVPFELPRGHELGPRLASVLEVVYLIFNEGYSATSGDDLVRPALMEEALRLGDLLVSLAPEEPEAHALSSLMLLQASRLPTRTDARGAPVLLTDQDRSRWDAHLIARGLEALTTAESTTGEPGPYRLQAAIAACHARAASVASTDWSRIAELYGQLARLTPSPVIELNRAVALSRAEGPAAGLAALDALADVPALARYHLLPSARADLLETLGRFEEARLEFLRAASLATNGRQRERLEARAARLRS